MAIFGAGSNWDGDEIKGEFFDKDNFIIGWDYFNAKDLYSIVSLLKVGDIIYLKANSFGSRKIRVKGIGVVTKSFVQSLIESKLNSYKVSDWNGFKVSVKWFIRDEFHIFIPPTEGRLTNVRSATFYEEHLPFVQREIINKLFNINLKNQRKMNYELGQFITGVISTSLQVFQLWQEHRNVDEIQSKIRQFDQITSSPQTIAEGQLLEGLIPTNVLNTLKGRVEICWSDFDDVMKSNNITPRQIDRYTEGLRECICRELKVIMRLNGSLPTQSMQNHWKEYKCVE